MKIKENRKFVVTEKQKNNFKHIEFDYVIVAVGHSSVPHKPVFQG